MAKPREFKSYKPRRYLSLKVYMRRYKLDECIAKSSIAGHLFKELCANCKKPFGAHCGLNCSRYE